MFPHAIAGAHIHIGTIAGKLNGVMPGDDAERLADRVHVDARSKPARSCRPSAGEGCRSRTRSPRARASPRPSRPTAPCRARRVRIFAISSRRSWTSSRIANRISARFAIESARHAGNAAFAAWTARSTSSTVAKSTAPRLLTGRRVVHGAAAAGRAGVRSAGDPVVDRLDCCGGVEDVGHGDSSLESSPGRLAPCSRRSQSSPRTRSLTCLPRPGFETDRPRRPRLRSREAPRDGAAAPPRRRRGSTRLGARRVRASGIDSLRVVGRLECDPGRPRASGCPTSGFVPDDEEATLTGMSIDREPPAGAARRRAPDRDARATACGARGRLGRVEPARVGASLAAGVRARALRARARHASTTSLRTRTIEPVGFGRAIDMDARRRADGRRRPACRSRARRVPRARPRALGARRRARHAAARRAGGTHVGAGARPGSAFGATACSSCSSIP